MEAYEWGMEWIIAIQAAGSPALKAFFDAVTFLGEEYFYLIIVPILYWSVDAATGARVGFAYVISAYVNLIVKDMFNQPRPYHINPSVSDREVAGSGMPSNHAQSSVLVWGVLAAQVKRPWFWLFAMVMAFLIGFSRVYLGVHFPLQVIAGWAFGGVLLGLFLLLDPRIEYAVGRLSLAPQLLVTVGVPVLLAVIYPHNDTVGAAAVMAGFGSGLVLCQHYVPYSAAGIWWKRIVRSVVGLAVLLALYFGLSAVFPGEEAGETVAYIFRFVRYGILGLWIGFGAPWVFSILHLLQEPEGVRELERT
jgi:membrane-associated phospholipid phosphatase